MLIVSPEFNCSNEILTIVAMLSGTFSLLLVLIRLIVYLAVPNIWIRPNEKRKEADLAKKRLSIPDGDHLTLLNVFDEYQNSTRCSTLFSPLLTNYCQIYATVNGHGITMFQLAPLPKLSTSALRFCELWNAWKLTW